MCLTRRDFIERYVLIGILRVEAHQYVCRLRLLVAPLFDLAWSWSKMALEQQVSGPGIYVIFEDIFARRTQFAIRRLISTEAAEGTPNLRVLHLELVRNPSGTELPRHLQNAIAVSGKLYLCDRDA